MAIGENIGWTFPICDDGPLTGADGADAASIFRATPIKAITKEVLQNSLDAVVNEEAGPVRVEFSVFSLPSSKLYGRDCLQDAILRAEAYADPKGNTQKEAFYKRAKDCIAQEEIRFLRISDYRTTGLTGAKANAKVAEEKKNSKWLHLVRGMGMSNKRNGDTGSHGKGKSAAIANSAISTIFYSTYAVDHCRAFAGVSYLSSFVDCDDHIHMGTGIYCVQDNNCTPIFEDVSLDPNHARTEYGTDIYIAGFANEQNWEKRVLISVLNEFLLSVYLEKIEIDLPSYKINKASLADLMKLYPIIREELELDEKENYADVCWTAINEPRIPAETETIKVGKPGKKIEATLLLYLTMGGKSTKVDMIRQKGMRIQAYNGRRAVPITGCLYIYGDKINQFLAGLEDEAHCEWQVNRAGPEHSDEVKEATKVLTDIRTYISRKIDLLFETSNEQRLEAEGMEDYFPIDLDDAGNQALVEATTPAIAQAPIKPYKPSKKSVELDQLEKGVGNEPYPEATDDPNETGALPRNLPGPGPMPGPGPGPIPPGPDPHPFEHPETGPVIIESQQALLTQPTKPIKLLRNKLIGKGDGGEYTLAIQVDQDCAALIFLNLSGEETQEKAGIASAFANDNSPLAVTEGIIGPVNLTGGKLEKIKVVLNEKLRCSWEVKVNAY